MAIEITKGDLLRWAAIAQSEVMTLKTALTDKGPKHFQRPLGLGAIIVFASYFYVFKATADVKDKIDAELATAKATAQYSEPYKELKNNLAEFQGKLPRVTNPGEWLLESIRATMRDEGIVPLSTSSPAEVTSGGYTFVSITVNCQAGYRQIASWIARLERGKKLLYVNQMRLKKDENSLGENSAEVKITTVVPKAGGEGAAEGGGAGPGEAQ